MVEFSNKWYRETCVDAGWNPDNILSESSVDLARQRALDMKMYMDSKENYNDKKLQEKLAEQIKRLDEERVEYMLNALFFAEVMVQFGKPFDKFLRNKINRRETLLKRGG